LTEKYHDQEEVDLKKKRLQIWISSRMESQSIFNFIKHFLEDEYPFLTQSLNFNEILLDIYSYAKYFDLSFNKIIKNPNYYLHTILYLILYHPDQKYRDLHGVIQLGNSEYQSLISEFKLNESLEEFQFKNSINNDLKFYLISEDPILHNFKEQIETYFQKFLICWEFPDVKFEENFDFLFHFSHFILDNELKKANANKRNLIKFFNENKICLLTFIREYLWEFLEKLKIESELEPPFKLLDFEEKTKILSKILLSSKIFPSSEKRNIENYFYTSGIEEERNFLFLKDLIMNLASKINDNIGKVNKYEVERLVYLKSHLLLLLKIFQTIDNNLYDNFRKSKEILTTFNQIKLSYSYFSDEIFNDIVELKIGLGEKIDYEKRSFTIRFLLERIDHILNLYSQGRMPQSYTIEKIKHIYNIVTSHFSENVQYPFIKKKKKIYSHDLNIFPDSEVSEPKIQIIKKNLENLEVPQEKFLFRGAFPKKEYELEEWGSIFKKYQNKPLRLIECLDILFFHNFNFGNIEKLEEFALLLLKYYGIGWTHRYLNLYFNYLNWYVIRKENISKIEIGLHIDRISFIQIIEFIANIFKAVIYWEYRERADTNKYIQEAYRIYNDLVSTNKDLFDSGLLNTFKLKLNGLKKKLL